MQKWYNGIIDVHLKCIHRYHAFTGSGIMSICIQNHSLQPYFKCLRRTGVWLSGYKQVGLLSSVRCRLETQNLTQVSISIHKTLNFR